MYRYAAATLAVGGARGVVAAVTNPWDDPKRWDVWGVPLARLMAPERRFGRDRLVIRKRVVDVDGDAFRAFARRRERWKLSDRYVVPGPAQLSGLRGSEREWFERLPITLRLRPGAACRRASAAMQARSILQWFPYDRVGATHIDP